MKVIKCDFCNQIVDYLPETYLHGIFANDSGVDLCESCFQELTTEVCDDLARTIRKGNQTLRKNIFIILRELILYDLGISGDIRSEQIQNKIFEILSSIAKNSIIKTISKIENIFNETITDEEINIPYKDAELYNYDGVDNFDYNEAINESQERFNDQEI